MPGGSRVPALSIILTEISRVPRRKLNPQIHKFEVIWFVSLTPCCNLRKSSVTVIYITYLSNISLNQHYNRASTVRALARLDFDYSRARSIAEKTSRVPLSLSLSSFSSSSSLRAFTSRSTPRVASRPSED